MDWLLLYEPNSKISYITWTQNIFNSIIYYRVWGGPKGELGVTSNNNTKYSLVGFPSLLSHFATFVPSSLSHLIGAKGSSRRRRWEAPPSPSVQPPSSSPFSSSSSPPSTPSTSPALLLAISKSYVFHFYLSSLSIPSLLLVSSSNFHAICSFAFIPSRNCSDLGF